MTGIRGRRAEEGSIALEFTLLAPALLLLVAFLLVCARFTAAGASLDAGVRDAARAATTSRSAAEAQQRAAAVVHAAVGPGACADSLVVEPLPEFTAGRPVTVTARCTVPVGDLGVPGVPGRLTVTSAFSSPLDPNRELS
ncbi:TadE/TadG family type IV pilus assembly protein [Kineococcus sp. LSe6-4]|uniref:TadE/TadG family type IV pilus assembly protein n=1 Tax=Kineococcus halophytocola TaxID=3234027 RepID=A0ABV4H217_9ACTN